ncbi:MAG: hypothetical protein NXI31_06920 [bacterium]|nr:hypothetical protein [bacterium]
MSRDDRDSDKYLWDRQGKADPTVAKLEELLAGFAHRGAEPDFGELTKNGSQHEPGRFVRRWPWLLAAAASLALGAWLLWPAAGLAPGDPARTFVAAKSPVVVQLGELAHVTLAPGSELQFEHWRSDEALFSLRRGALTAKVAPPPAVAPGFFLVDTPLGRVTDKGCEYELRIASDGTHHITVTEGAVTFTFGNREVFVPAGASTHVTASGPSLPMFGDATAELRKAATLFDRTDPDRAGRREKAAFAIGEACRDPRDSLVLWHLLLDDDQFVRGRAEMALLELVGAPIESPSKVAAFDPETWLAWLRLEFWTK